MNKSKKTTTKIISGMILFLFIISLFGFALPTQINAETSLSNLYANPNQSTSNSNTYKFKISDVVNSNLLTNVVGCTGVVTKVSSWMVKFIQSPAQQEKILKAKLKKIRTQLENACAAGKASAEAGGDSIPTIGGLSKSIDTILAKINVKINGGDLKTCQDQVKAVSDDALAIATEEVEKDTERDTKEQCFDGIAITLAKNQLTAMTRSAMNWVNSGYGGNSFFVQNMIGLANNIEQNVLQTGIDILLAPNGNQSPYAKNFVESTVRGRNLISSSTNFLGNLQSDLESFVTDPKSYYTDKQLNKAQDTRTALQRAQEANDVFANNFSSGGWDAYLALTQRDQNNPLGFTMVASQYLADQQVKKVAETQSELDRNNGFLSQKECVLWELYDENGKPKYPDPVASGIAGNTTKIQSFVPLKSATKTSNFDKCVDWKVTTPGSIIKDKVTNYLNSPERQLELADTINESLNALFSILISKLEQGGLSGLSDSVKNTSNWEDTTNEYVSADGNTTYDNGGAYNDFNLTRDLGNNYIYDNIVKLGTWNAKTNTATNIKYTTFPSSNTTKTIKLYPNTAPENYEMVEGTEELVYPTNGYYEVTLAGKTKLITAGYNNWEVGDRAFWNGSEWQNWKKGQANPIKKRGVVQIQNDYIVAAKEMLGVLPSVMTNLGKLDYCLPGPNPSYKTNSTDAQSAYQDWIGSSYIGIYDTTGKRYGVNIDTDGERTYDNLKAIYKDNLNVWTQILGDINENLYPDLAATVKETGYSMGAEVLRNMDAYVKLLVKRMNYLIYEFSNICNGSRSNCKGEYTYTGTNISDDESDIINEKQEMKEKVEDYVNNHMFTNFYDTFERAMDAKYFKKMTNYYSDTEQVIGVTKNPAYVPMAEAGFDLTKNILYYNDDVEKAKSDYTEAMSVARVNISKLEPIKSEVSGIIKNAQDRRNKELATTLGLTLDQVKTKYKTCIDEENIEFYDADNITSMGSANDENCSDGIDNDLNGLVDMKDPNCLSAKTKGSYYCTISSTEKVATTKNKITMQDRGSCYTNDKDICESSSEQDANGKTFWCKWVLSKY